MCMCGEEQGVGVFLWAVRLSIFYDITETHCSTKSYCSYIYMYIVWVFGGCQSVWMCGWSEADCGAGYWILAK